MVQADSEGSVFSAIESIQVENQGKDIAEVGFIT